MRTALRVMAVCWAVAATLLLLIDTPWLPAERIVRFNQPAITGYVIHADHDQLLILTNNSRMLERIDASSVRSRLICRVEQTSHSWQRP